MEKNDRDIASPGLEASQTQRPGIERVVKNIKI
jgi:hypothetical protein